MYKLVILTKSESAFGFRLAGVDVLEANDAEEAKKQLVALINDDRSGIVAIDEDLMAQMDDRVKEKIDKLYRPIVIPIPAKDRVESSDARPEYIRRLIRRAVGFDIKLGQG
ncbi:MAG: V-type ATP synthase subunit F [Actinobacteria bacterium]|nr:V-type ATP synthase subunit F [Actinomycetota bacterium]